MRRLTKRALIRRGRGRMSPRCQLHAQSIQHHSDPSDEPTVAMSSPGRRAWGVEGSRNCDRPVFGSRVATRAKGNRNPLLRTMPHTRLSSGTASRSRRLRICPWRCAARLGGQEREHRRHPPSGQPSACKAEGHRSWHSPSRKLSCVAHVEAALQPGDPDRDGSGFALLGPRGRDRSCRRPGRARGAEASAQCPSSRPPTLRRSKQAP